MWKPGAHPLARQKKSLKWFSWKCLTQLHVQIFGVGGSPCMYTWKCIVTVTQIRDGGERAKLFINVQFKKVYPGDTLRERSPAAWRGDPLQAVPLWFWLVVAVLGLLLSAFFKDSWSWSRTGNDILPWSPSPLTWSSRLCSQDTVKPHPCHWALPAEDTGFPSQKVSLQPGGQGIMSRIARTILVPWIVIPQWPQDSRRDKLVHGFTVSHC